ncbi:MULTISPECIES: GNAT family N-acetyltransferase [unclassified Chelatococcus]|uniref:GNAT family N-acetyltransferase n=1 Tax=unclassified Chelatococcus TaxID=2638111 RepID=UPI001BCF5AA7|nr:MULTISPECIES: GNAT family N-acetyltransferase [unclassified Chelatococcus]CAH1669491.1 GNAT family N-acetyltransferase [Hyphomicrobiales bacterium]MBS7738213.1 GNAT family N-acetyltransferase [Chelatococcus sp. HY11]MBX3545741.1 GNAT family N-acetyltransferase [Chelatococcus sp.]MCO5077441.1 GNAT family N-acetyltransferase [Chelatococcus sp.]CAH1678296.1 GNAT family N-acetyltransferase [Hyphomicrobiales bacterium]
MSGVTGSHKGDALQDQGLLGSRADDTSRPEVVLACLDAGEIADLDPNGWDELSRHALEPNPFYSRGYVLAGLQTIDRHIGLRIGVMTAAGRMIGLFPFHRRGPRGRGIAIAAGNLYQFCGTPLVHRDYAEAVLERWTVAARQGELPALWRFNHIGLEGPLMALWARVLARHGHVLRRIYQYERPRLTYTEGGFETHCRQFVSKTRVKDVQRTIRRLEELGKLRFERATHAADIRQRLEDFLAIENAGWKGRAGSSFLARPQDARFARLAFRGGQGLGTGSGTGIGTGAIPGSATTVTDSLLLDDKPIAVSLNLVAGNTMFTPKTTYDEAYRRYSPGLVLEVRVMQAFFDEHAGSAAANGAAMDAATTMDGHLVQGLWNTTRMMGSVLIGPDRRRTYAQALYESGHHRLREAAKTYLKGYRGLK